MYFLFGVIDETVGQLYRYLWGVSMGLGYNVAKKCTWVVFTREKMKHAEKWRTWRWTRVFDYDDFFVSVLLGLRLLREQKNVNQIMTENLCFVGWATLIGCLGKKE